MADRPTVQDALNAASIGELSWVAADGRPRVEGVVPLVLDGLPAVAFTYAHRDLALDVGSARAAAVAVTEPRSTGTGFRPLVAIGRPRLIHDPDGELFTERLLDQELRRHPPSRLLADSVLLRREHWWYLPRLVLTIDVDIVAPLPVRAPRDDTGAGGHLLTVARHDGRVEVHVVTATTPADHTSPISVGPLPDTPEQPFPESGPAALFCQDASFPDVERWSQWTVRGQWDARSGVFTVTEPPSVGSVGLEPVPSLMRRWRRQRHLERGCRKGLAAGS